MKKPTYNEKAKQEGREPIDRQNTKWSQEITAKCEHEWQPVSFAFETQLLDDQGRVKIRQPDLANGRVYCVCMKCLGHTYVRTGYVGYYIGSPDDLEAQ